MRSDTENQSCTAQSSTSLLQIQCKCSHRKLCLARRKLSQAPKVCKYHSPSVKLLPLQLKRVVQMICCLGKTVITTVVICQLTVESAVTIVDYGAMLDSRPSLDPVRYPCQQLHAPQHVLCQPDASEIASATILQEQCIYVIQQGLRK